MAIRSINKYFWILEGVLLIGIMGLVGEVLWERALQKEYASEVLLLAQKIREYWQCSPEELEMKYRSALNKLRERITSLEERLFWIGELKEENLSGIDFMRRIKQIESRFKNSFPNSHIPENLGFPTQMPPREKIPYYAYYLSILERIVPVILANGGEIDKITPVVDLNERNYTLSLGFRTNLAVVLKVFREVNSVPVINLTTLEIRPANEEIQLLSVEMIFSPFVKEDFSVEKEDVGKVGEE